MSIACGSRHSCDQSPNAAHTVETPCAKRDRAWVLAASVLGSSLAFIESSIVNLALPDLQLDLDLGSIELQWIVNSYLLMLGSLLMIGGASGDRIGLRRVYLLGLALFGGASFGCAVAPGYGWLLTWRILQGTGAALLVPTSLAIINVHFDEESRGRAIGIWAGASALTTALGPVIGGALVDVAGWRAVFAIIVPLSAAALLVALWRLPHSEGRAQGAVDWLGAGLLAASLWLFTYVLINAGGSVESYLMIGLSVVGMGAFLVREATARAPLVPLGLFRSLPFSGANAMTMALYFALAGALYFIPFNLIQVQGYSALAAGAAFLPMTLMLGFGSALAGEQLKRYPARNLLTVGSLLAGSGFALLAIPGTESDFVNDWLPGILAMGFGMTLCVAPLTTVVMGSVDAERSGIASGINNTAARFAGALAIALLSALAIQLFSNELSTRLADLAVSESIQQEMLAGSHRLAELAPPADAIEVAALREAVTSSYVSTFRRLMMICAGFAALAAVLAWFTLGAVENARGGQAEDKS